MATGGLHGGILGRPAALALPGISWAAAAGIIGAAAAGGAFGGSLWGPLVETGLSEERVEHLDEGLKAGDFIIVHDDYRAVEDQRITEDHGGSTAHAR